MLLLKIVDIGPRASGRLHRYGDVPDCVDKYYLIFGDFDEQYKAFSLAPLLTKLLPVQSVASVTFYTWIFVARLAVDFVAASKAAAAGACGGAGHAGSVVRRICRCCDRCPCVVVSPMHPPPIWTRLCGPSREASQACVGLPRRPSNSGFRIGGASLRCSRTALLAACSFE